MVFPAHDADADESAARWARHLIAIARRSAPAELTDGLVGTADHFARWADSV